MTKRTIEHLFRTPKTSTCLQCGMTLRKNTLITVVKYGSVVKHRFCDEHCQIAKTRDNQANGIVPGSWSHRQDCE